MRQIDEFTIHSFRGIRDLKLEGTGQINLLVGNNNSGKTSVLEALFLFSDSMSRGKWLDTASMREEPISALSQSERISWFFPRIEDAHSSKTEAEILLTARGSFLVEKVSAHYEKFSEIQEIVPGSSEAVSTYEDSREIEGIRVYVSCSKRPPQPVLPSTSYEHGTLQETLTFSGSRLRLSLTKRPGTVLPSQVVHPSSHRLASAPSQLWSDVVNAENKADAIALLRFFDHDIQDVDIILGSAGRPTVSIKHTKLERAPLSVFGDGLRRAFILAAAIPGARNGLLLVDELETAVHKSALEKTFSWLVNACVQNNVQLVATTHSLEAVDALIDACSGDTTELVAYRLEEEKGHMSATRFDKGLLTRLREELGMEVR